MVADAEKEATEKRGQITLAQVIGRAAVGLQHRETGEVVGLLVVDQDPSPAESGGKGSDQLLVATCDRGDKRCLGLLGVGIRPDHEIDAERPDPRQEIERRHLSQGIAHLRLAHLLTPEFAAGDINARPAQDVGRSRHQRRALTQASVAASGGTADRSR